MREARSGRSVCAGGRSLHVVKSSNTEVVDVLPHAHDPLLNLHDFVTTVTRRAARG